MGNEAGCVGRVPGVCERPKLIDGVDAFHAAFVRGQIVPAPPEYVELILAPAILHIDPMRFMEYPPAMRMRITNLLWAYIGMGNGMNLQVVRHDDGTT